MNMIRAEILIQGSQVLPGDEAEGEKLILSAPISFWGGINPKNGMISDVRHPEHGLVIAGRILCLPGTIGSSSAAAVLLELVHAGKAPAALILHEPDAILLLGLIVAREMGYATPSALQLDRTNFSTLTAPKLRVSRDGEIRAVR